MLVNCPVHVYVVTQRHQENNGNLKHLVKITQCCGGLYLGESWTHLHD